MYVSARFVQTSVPSSALRTPSPVSGSRDLSLGFTLIEILVVILITGITLSFALMAFGDFGEKRRIIVAAEQFNNYVKLMQQQAILETATFGISINKSGYQMVRFQAPDKWFTLSSRGIFHNQNFPKGLLIKLHISSAKPGAPAIIINSSGDLTPFTLDFGSTQQPKIMTLTGKANGELRILRAKLP